MEHKTAAIRPPFLGLALLEPARCMMEAGALVALSPLLSLSPRGDGHPVVVLPGFATNDTMTVLLRSFLKQLSYDVYPMDLGWNFDQHTVGENGEHIAERIRAIRSDTGRKVSLVGWSLGGVIAREAARRDPDDLRQVISLGSPFSGNPRATNLQTVYQFATGNDFNSAKMVERYRIGADALPIPSTAVFSRTDGVTAWENCLGDTDEINENVEVVSSHFGFMTNPAVFHVIADRLGQAEGQWQPFQPSVPFASFYA
ncbi:esterase/lipase family protein [Novosphingobium mathurense]|uniref:Alpha/beta hydrolase family protein n=1 Tax=Novosphingobium mathurense TaxID=428990 RepID=A0A1U6GRE2_9SPHN|nr:alpha/beta hydrolase [Novosphingobium mathurense]SLJ86107.1 Alpha/beta hydrolase family protein [Novosphingobium mathurense]